MKAFKPLEDPESLMPILSRIAFLGAVTDEQRGEICKLLEVGTFEEGEYISRREEQPSRIYIIRKGKVNLELTDKDVVMHKREFNVGDCFGEAALLSMTNNTASFVAAEESELVVLSRQSLNRLRRENQDLFCILILNLARELARKLQYTDEIMLRLGLDNTD
ncbi:cyclic nucleotide-binding domain-containing protein [Haloferula sp.]|uniref:cyclic nucleotide-binding domain-containing protein n=1 Tax=Haloferula sp. TaxID=2497595 RepID=UPI00329EF4E3